MFPAVKPSTIRDRNISHREFANASRMKPNKVPIWLKSSRGFRPVRSERRPSSGPPKQLTEGIHRYQHSHANRTRAVMFGVERKQWVHDGHPKDVHYNNEEYGQKRGGHFFNDRCRLGRGLYWGIEHKNRAGPSSSEPALDIGSIDYARQPVEPASAMLLYRPGSRAQRMSEIDQPAIKFFFGGVCPLEAGFLRGRVILC